MINLEKKVVLISASPKIGEESASDLLVSLQEAQLGAAGLTTTRINMRQCFTRKTTESAFAEMQEADVLVFTFPLYFWSLPGMVMRFLEDYIQYHSQNQDAQLKTKVYAAVNCGFPEPGINEEAVYVIKKFSNKVGAEFRFGIMIGGGPLLINTAEAPFMKKTFTLLNNAFKNMGQDILYDGQPLSSDVLIPVNMPHVIYRFFMNRWAVTEGKKNGLKKKELYRKPFWSQ